jgi:tRNA threonylcarbamoyladenosine biosynthesis protein TsaB
MRYREMLSGVGRIPPAVSPLHRVTAAGHVLSADLSPVPVGEAVPLYVREPDAEVRRGLNPWSKV